MMISEGEETEVSDPVSDVSSDVRNGAVAVDTWQPEDDDDVDDEAALPQIHSGHKRSRADVIAATPRSSSKKV
jgi:hypothetical protein